jgi:hypothetical protein
MIKISGADKKEVLEAAETLMKNYYCILLLHFTDGSILMRKLDNETIDRIQKQRAIEENDE